MTSKLLKLSTAYRDSDSFREPDLNNPADKVKALMAVFLESASPMIAAEAFHS